MAQINTSVEVIEVGKKIVEKFEATLNRTAQNLNKTYEKAGQAGWDDKQYQNLGVLIQECAKGLTKPVEQLEQLKGKLDQLKKAVENYSK